jgi:hypothetical protein
MTNTYGTNFVESEAILAAQADDADTLARLVADMLPGERRSLALAATSLTNVLWDAEGQPSTWGSGSRLEGLRREVATLLADGGAA